MYWLLTELSKDILTDLELDEILEEIDRLKETLLTQNLTEASNLFFSIYGREKEQRFTAYIVYLRKIGLRNRDIRDALRNFIPVGVISKIIQKYKYFLYTPVLKSSLQVENTFQKPISIEEKI
jgi:hypothetical protein